MLSILLAAQSGTGGGGGMGFNIMLVLVLVIFYVFMILPQVRKSKQQKKFREAIGKGDKVITIGGIHARIVDVGESHFIIDSEGTRLRVDKTAISMEASQPLNKDKEKEAKEKEGKK